MTIDFNRPELYETVCGDPFVIYDVAYRHGRTKDKAINWDHKGYAYFGVQAIPGYNLKLIDT